MLTLFQLSTRAYEKAAAELEISPTTMQPWMSKLFTTNEDEDGNGEKSPKKAARSKKVKEEVNDGEDDDAH